MHMRRYIALAMAAAIWSVVPARAQTAGVDGIYRPAPGGDRGIGCNVSNLNTTLHVEKGTARMRTSTRGDYEGPVAADGSFSVQRGGDTLSGTFKDGHFNGTFVAGRACHFDMHYDRG